jgi:hypothetical protein
MLMGAMLASLIMAAAFPRLSGNRGLAFAVVAYAALPSKDGESRSDK